ncbi:MAG: hypothetical protein ACFFB3_01505 [Candidatus Hodarchaeota archaeon]
MMPDAIPLFFCKTTIASGTIWVALIAVPMRRIHLAIVVIVTIALDEADGAVSK